MEFNLYKKESLKSHLPVINENELSDQDVLTEIHALKEKLKDKLVILGHHYQQDDVIEFADITGDSLQLSMEAAKISKKYILFCGVHFMAETADMLTSPEQVVILPDLKAGCSMADMANRREIDKAWNVLTEVTKETIIPITYINCTASLKSFVGENNGSICTSSNAKEIIQWALESGEKLLFFPDQHLGRNTCFELGIPLEQMVVYNPTMKNGGLTPKQIQDAKVILWYGYCSVHQGFQVKHVLELKEKSPDTIVIVHPECSFEVVQQAHLNGSTSYIINTIDKAPEGSKFAVGTEINLVNRLNQKYPNKTISSLSPYQCLCTTMYRVRPRWLLASLRAIAEDKPINVISVDKQTTEFSLKALEKMFEVTRRNSQ